MQEKFTTLLEYSYCSLADIQKWVGLKPETSLFKTLLVFENIPPAHLKNDFFEIQSLKVRDTIHYPLNIIVNPANKLELKLIYDSFIIEEPAAEALLAFFVSLIEIALEQPLKPLIWQPRPTPLLEGSTIKLEKSVIEAFEEQVLKQPQNVAVIDNKKAMTYQELSFYSNQLADYLIKKGLKRGMLVGISLERSRFIPLAILAILKAGAGYVPLDPHYPQKRLEFILHQSQIRLILIDQHTHSTFINLSNNLTEIFKIEEPFEWLSNKTKKTFKPKGLLNNLAYVMYTSGSTGNPKGVMVTHSNLYNVLFSLAQCLKIRPSDRWLAITSISFDISVAEFFVPFITGACCVIAPSDAVGNPQLLLTWLHQYQINILQATPITWKRLLQIGWQHDGQLTVITGGEAISQETAAKLLEKGHSFWNAYGPTETAIWSSLKHVESLKSLPSTVPIGLPLANTQFYILNQKRQPLFVGMVGELYIGGEGVTKGYWKSPTLTRQRFLSLNTPYKKVRVFKTGDLVRYLPNQELEFINRVDNQIKLNGLRIDLLEIEGALLKLEAIEDAVVTLKESEKKIIAYLILKSTVSFEATQIKNQLAELLPFTMIPTELIPISEFPLLPNGKVDRKSLSSQIENKEKSTLSHRKPSTEIEKVILKTIQEVIGNNRLHLEDNFFEAGADSLKVIQILSRLRELFHLSLEMKELFYAPTVQALAQQILKRSIEAETLSTLSQTTDFIIPLSSKITDKEPLFLIHPVGGTIFWYLPLIRYISNRSLWGIQDPGICCFQKTPPFSSLKAMATFYLKAIQTLQPRGPYLLGGASMGANIAVEIASQLEQAGEKVAFLGLMDGWAFYPKTVSEKAWFKKTMKTQQESIKYQFKEVRLSLTEKALFEVQWHRSQLLAEHQSSYIQSEITLFKAKEILPVFNSIDSSDNYWQAFSSKKMNIHLVSGNHETLFQEPNVFEMGQILNTLLNNI